MYAIALLWKTSEVDLSKSTHELMPRQLNQHHYLNHISRSEAKEGVAKNRRQLQSADRHQEYRNRPLERAHGAYP